MVSPDTKPSNRVDIADVTPFGVLVQAGTADADIMEVPIPVARDLVRRHRILVLRGFRSFGPQEELARYAASWGQLLSWSFGDVLELVEHEQAVDHVFDNSKMWLHWDGVFVEQIPEFQIFQCVNAPEEAQGGRTVFCDTARVLADAPASTRELWENLTLTYRVAKKSHYGGVAVSPLVVAHPDQEFPTMRYLEPVPGDIDYRNRPIVEFTDVPPEQVADITQTLRDALYDPRHYYAHRWQTGDVVIADNYTLLHGREPYASGCGRHLRRVHVLGDPPLKNPALR